MSEQDEPSMEDILSSIRKILSDDIGDSLPEETHVEPISEPEPLPLVVVADDIVNLTSEMVIEETPKPLNRLMVEELISPPIQHVAACKFAEFAKFMAEEKVAYMGNGKVTLEHVIKELLRPILKEWLDANLEAIVEKMVEKEIQRVGDKIKLF